MSGSYGAPLELFSVDPVTGAQVVLADTSTTNLLAELPVLETEADGVNLGLQLADGAQIGFSSTARLADFLYAVSVQQLQATSFVTDNYNLDMQWLDTVDEPLLNEAVSWSEQAANETAAGGAYETSLADENNAQAGLALKIAAEAPGSRQDMSVTINNPYTGNPTQVTVYAGGGNSVHDYAPSIVNYIESAIGVVVNILAVVYQQPEFYWAAAAIDSAEAGQDFANGEDLQGILSVAQALSAGITADVGVPQTGQIATTAQVTAQALNVASQAVGGIYGIVESAENGNGVGILAGALEAAAAAAAGIGIDESGSEQRTLNLVSTALGAASVATDVGEDFASGNLGQGLVDSLNLFLPEVAQAYSNYQENHATSDNSASTPPDTPYGQSSTIKSIGTLSAGEMALLSQVNSEAMTAETAPIDLQTLMTQVKMDFVSSATPSQLAANLASPYSPSLPNYHEYSFADYLCSLSTPGCTFDAAYAALLKYAVPGGPNQGTPVTDGQLSPVSFLGIPGGDIRTYLDPSSYAIINVTEPNHELANGIVEHQIVEANGNLYLDTHGVGNNTSGFMAAVNVYLAGPAFAASTEAIRLTLNPNLAYPHPQLVP